MITAFLVSIFALVTFWLFVFAHKDSYDGERVPEYTESFWFTVVILLGIGLLGFLQIPKPEPHTGWWGPLVPIDVLIGFGAPIYITGFTVAYFSELKSATTWLHKKLRPPKQEVDLDKLLVEGQQILVEAEKILDT